MFKIAFLVAVAVSGITEWFKNLIPEKVKENNVIMAVIAAVFSVIGGSLVAFIPGFIPQIYELATIPKLIFIGGIVALTQTSYNLLFQTFKAIKARLTEKIKLSPDSIADEVAEKVIDEVSKLK
jgi:predicted PurR-regulated permease PerM